MAIGCGAKISKFILFIFNILFWISGLILIVTGTIYVSSGTLKNLEEIIQLDDRTVTKLMYAMIGLGCIIFIIGFCGCCGAIRESRLLLGIYIGLLLVIMFAEGASGIYAMFKKPQVISKIDEELEKLFNQGYPSDKNVTQNQDLKRNVDKLQQFYKCCGVNGPLDWRNSSWYQGRTADYMETPMSCCPSQTEEDKRPCHNDKLYYSEGCSTKIQDILKSKFPVVIGILAGIALFEVLVVIFACCLCNNTGHTQHSTI